MSGSASSSFRAEGFTSTAYLLTQPAALHQVRRDLLDRYPLLLAARLRNQAVKHIVEECPVLLQVDEDADLAALPVPEWVEPITKWGEIA